MNNQSTIQLNKQSILAFFNRHPELETIQAFVIDINGQARGKQFSVNALDKLIGDQIRLPRTSVAVDIWGNDVFEAGFAIGAEATDSICIADAKTISIVPWLDSPSAQIIMCMANDDRSPFFADPRNVLNKIINAFNTRGLFPVMAAESEFYLYDPVLKEGKPQPPLAPLTGKRLDASQCYGIEELNHFESFLTDLRQACEIQQIPLDSVICEDGIGQFEANLHHIDDPLLAADYVFLIKQAIKGIARKHQIEATFMSKPFSGKMGSGMHVHMSILDEKGHNIFQGEDAQGSQRLLHAIGGLNKNLNDCMAIFAANANAYKRFQSQSHAPTRVGWGYDNRSAAIRIPNSSLAATRIEHRIAGADANPYLVFASILAATLDGFEHKTKPGAALSQDHADLDLPQLPKTWEHALDEFEQSEFVARYMGEPFRSLFSVCKRREKQYIDELITDVEYQAYLSNA